MKHKTVKTSNVVRFLSALKGTRERSASEEGMLFLYGEPGEGKTTTITHCWNQRGGYYVRAMRHWTPLAMLQSLCREMEVPVAGRTAMCFQRVTERLVERPGPLFIDEVDYLFDSADMLDTLRDIYDTTKTPVVFCGEKDNAERVQSDRRFVRFKRRFLKWVEFDGLSREDTAKVARELLEGVSVTKPLAGKLHEETAGQIDALVKELGSLERAARRNDLREMDVETWEAGRDGRSASLRRVAQ